MVELSGIRFRVLAVTSLACVVLLGVVGALREAQPAWTDVVVFGCLVVIVENIGFRLPTSASVSPQIILIAGAITALHHQGVIEGAVIVGACGSLYLPALRARRFAVFVVNVGIFGLSAGTTAVVADVLLTRVSVALAYPAIALTYVAVNVVLCGAALLVRDGVSAGDLWADMRQPVIGEVFFAIIGLIIGTLYHRYGAITLVVAAGAALVAQAVFLSFVKLRQAYTRLEVLYRFTEALQRSREEPDAISSILDELRGAMDAGTAEITILETDSWRRTAHHTERRRPESDEGPGSPPECAAVREGPLQITDLTPGSDVRQTLENRLGASGMIAPMRNDGRLIGLLAVGHPASGKAFGPEDLRLLETLTNHATVTLDNSHLLGQLRYDSSHDRLTGLPNRTRFTELLADLPRPSAILLIDLDRFKEINDTLGHGHGDLLLRSVADRIADEVGHRGIVARLGGDEFGVLLPQTGSSNAAQTAVALLAALEQPFQIAQLELEITGSIGVAVAGELDDDTTRLLQQADVAMYSAKEAHSGWELYTSERDHYSPKRLALAGELRRAIESGEMEVHYQPKADLRTGAICGLEALVRWRHPRYGLLGPDNFIPVAESAGLIRPLTLLVLSEAIGQLRSLHSLGYELGMAVNLSVRSVLDVHLPEQIAQVLDAHGVAPAALTLEITEGSVMADPARTIGILGRLAALGAKISVDDFGTGYSSLSYLKRLPADEVKIDRSFVAGMLATDSDAAIVRSTVDLARNLGLQAVAEGVEDSATWDALLALGCDLAQGYFVSAPLPADQLGSWLLTTGAATDPRT